MGLILVGIGEIGFSDDPEDSIKTMALGSCVGLVFLVPKIKMAALAHVALPDSSIGSNQQLVNRPGYFADKAVKFLLREFRENFNISNPADIAVKMAGGASIMDPHGTFNIGKRNVIAIKKMLDIYKLKLYAEDVGKNFGRTVWIEMKTGKIYISSPGRGQWEL